MSSKRNIRIKRERRIKQEMRNAAIASSDKEAYFHYIRINRIIHGMKRYDNRSLALL